MTSLTQHTTQLVIEVDSLEIARGHDGLFRGDPEPVLVVACYAIEAAAVRTIGRSVHRFAARRPFPSTAPPDTTTALAVEITHRGPLHVAVVACAIEEDAGIGVQTAFGALEHHSSLALWPWSSENPTPISLGELPRDPEDWRTPTPVQLMSGERELAELCAGDKWIGGVCWLLRSIANAKASQFRLPFLAGDRRNDWTALLRVSSHVRPE